MPLSGQKRAFEERASEDASCSTSESAGALEEQRAERHYIMRVDDRFDGERYRVIKQLGKGTFGRVVEMWDEQERTHVAVKVVRAVEKYSREAEIEAEILLAVQKDAALDLPIGRLIRSFSSQGHRCLVFGKLGPSLYHALRGVKREAERRSRGKALHAGRFFSLAAISRVALDCFRALAHLHAIKLAHTDLKPENVLFAAAGRPDVSSGTAGVAIIDFGGATWEHEHHSSIVCTRQYRPAEVTLGAGWDSSVDLWSMGCILAELWTGSPDRSPSPSPDRSPSPSPSRSPSPSPSPSATALILALTLPQAGCSSARTTRWSTSRSWSAPWAACRPASCGAPPPARWTRTSATAPCAGPTARTTVLRRRTCARSRA